MERYWVPSTPRSALFGTDIADYWFPVAQGGDIAFLYGVLKILIEHGWIDRDVRRRSTPTGFDELAAAVDALDWRDARGAVRPAAREHARSSPTLIRDARTARARLEHGHHAARLRRRRGADDRSTSACCKGYVGREQLRPDADPRPLRRAGRRRDGRLRDGASRRHADQRRERRARSSRTYGFPVPDAPGLTAHRDGRGRARAASSTCSTASAAISCARCPSPTTSPRALARVPLRVHQDIIAHRPDADRARRRRASCCRPRRATSRTAAAPRPPPSGA